MSHFSFQCDIGAVPLLFRRLPVVRSRGSVIFIQGIDQISQSLRDKIQSKSPEEEQTPESGQFPFMISSDHQILPAEIGILYPLI